MAASGWSLTGLWRAPVEALCPHAVAVRGRRFGAARARAIGVAQRDAMADPDVPSLAEGDSDGNTNGTPSGMFRDCISRCHCGGAGRAPSPFHWWLRSLEEAGARQRRPGPTTVSVLRLAPHVRACTNHRWMSFGETSSLLKLLWAPYEFLALHGVSSSSRSRSLASRSPCGTARQRPAFLPSRTVPCATHRQRASDGRAARGAGRGRAAHPGTDRQ